MEKLRAFGRGALWALPIWAAMLFAGTITHQPDAQTAFGEWSKYVTTSEFLWSHLINSIAGAVFGCIGVIGLMLYLLETRAGGNAFAGMLATVASNVLLSSVFGVAAFAQPVLGRAFLAGQQDAFDYYHQVYGGDTLLLTAAVAILLFIVGGVLVGIAISRSGRFPRWTGWVYAISAALFGPSNFVFPVGQSIFSALLFIAAVVLAWHAGRASRLQESTLGVPAGS